MSKFLVDFLENFYGLSLEELGAHLRDADYDGTKQLLRLGEFAELYAEQFVAAAGLPVSTARAGPTPIFYRAGVGITQHLSPGGSLTGFSGVDSRGKKVALLSPYSALDGCFGAPTQSDSKELKSVLLYSDNLVLIDPFSVRRRLSEVEWLALEEEFSSEYLNPTGMYGMYATNRRVTTAPLAERSSDVSQTLQLLADIAPLLRKDIARVITLPSRKAVYWGDEEAVRHEIGREVFVRGDAHPFRFRESQLIAFVLLERAKDQILALATLGGDVCAFASGDLDVVALQYLLDELVRLDSEMEGPVGPIRSEPALADAAALWGSRSSEDERLTELARLQLPGVDTLRPKDMVTVRERDVFVHFRSDVRHALASTMQESRIDVAAHIFAEEMQAANARMRLPRHRDALASSGGQAVSWVAGAIVGWSVAGWRGAAAGVAAGAVLELRRQHDVGRTALRNHYLAFS